MKQAILISCVSLLLVVTGAQVSRAGSDCVTVKGTSLGETFTNDFPFAPFGGTASLRTSQGELAAGVTVIATAPPVVKGNVTFIPTQHHYIVSNDFVTVGEFWTEDNAVLAETGKPGLLRLNSRLRIVAGNWMGSAASGKLVTNGTIQLVPSDASLQAFASWRVKGHICVSCEYSLGMECPSSGDANVEINGGFINLPPPCSPVARATWDWGDGAVDEFLPVGDPPYVYPFPNSHVYGESGSYTITLRLFDSSDRQLDEASCDLQID